MKATEEFTSFHFIFPRQSIKLNAVVNTVDKYDSVSPLLKKLTEKLTLL